MGAEPIVTNSELCRAPKNGPKQMGNLFFFHPSKWSCKSKSTYLQLVGADFVLKLY